MDEVDLPQIRLTGIHGHPGAMLHRVAEVRVADDSHARHDVDGLLRVLADSMARSLVYCAHRAHWDGGRRTGAMTTGIVHHDAAYRRVQGEARHEFGLPAPCASSWNHRTYVR
jgi:hypothetical protein